MGNVQHKTPYLNVLRTFGGISKHAILAVDVRYVIFTDEEHMKYLHILKADKNDIK
jgi:hypothetical protein